jgi:hypothetical protein
MERIEYRNLALSLLGTMHDEVSSCSETRAREMCILMCTLFQLERNGRLEGFLSTEGSLARDDPIYVITLGLLANHLTRPKNEPSAEEGEPGHP